MTSSTPQQTIFATDKRFSIMKVTILKVELICKLNAQERNSQIILMSTHIWCERESYKERI